MTLRWPAALLLLAGGALAQAPPGDAAAGRMLYLDTPLQRGSLQACAQCHPNPLNQRRGITLEDQQDHIRCAIQGGCGGATLAVYPFGNMAQFQGLLSGVDIQHLARYIREPLVSAAWPRLQPRSSELPLLPLGQMQALTLDLTNAGEQALRVRSLRLEGAGAADYALPASPICAEALATGAACRLQLLHAPRCGLRREARLLVEHDGPLSPAVSRLSGGGQGAAPPEAQVEPSRLDFHALQDIASSLALRVVNACGGELQLTALRVEGGFERSDDRCDNARLSAASGCELRLRRRLADGAPDALQAMSGALWIESVGNPPLRVPLSAEALAPARPVFRAVASLPAPRAGESLRIEAGQLRNEGVQSLQIQALRSSDPAFVLDNTEGCRDGLLLAPGAQCALHLRVTASVAGPASTQLTLRAAPGAVALTAELRLQVSAAVAPQTPATSSGGSAGPVFLLLLALAAALLNRPSRRSASS